LEKYILLLLIVPAMVWALDPPWTQSPAYSPNIAYFYNEYTRQKDGVWLGSVTTSSDSLRLGGQLPSYYATASSVSGLNTNYTNLYSSWTTTNNGLNAITGKTSGGVQSYLAITSTDTVKWYITISTQGRVWVQNFLP
jgi:hypothetical protein